MSLFNYDPVRFSKWLEWDPLLRRNTPPASSNVSEQEIEVITGLENVKLPPLEPVIEATITATGSSENVKESVWADIAKLFSSEELVVEIWVNYSDESFYVLTLIKSYDREARKRLIQFEKQIIDKYFGIAIDFSILSLDGGDSSDLVTDLARIYPKD